MPLETAIIQAVEGASSGQPVKVRFNPTEYSLETSNQFQRTAVPGTSTPLTQFVNGNTQTLTMDLLFDSYERGEDVRIYTRTLTSLMDIDPGLHAPPVCGFYWGSLSFIATIEQITQKFTLFLESGVPARATLSVTFKEYRTLTEQLAGVRKESSDRTKRLTVKRDDYLWLVANREYENPNTWRPIASANKISNPRIMKVGQELVIPVLKK